MDVAKLVVAKVYHTALTTIIMFRRLEVCHRRCVSILLACLAWEDLFANDAVLKSAEKAEPSETPWHAYDGTPTTA